MPVLSWLVVLAVARAADPPPDAPPPDSPRPADATLRGRVLEFGSGDPVPATIHVGDLTTTTDADGRFELAVPSGDLAVHVSSDRWRPLDTPEHLAPGEILDVLYRVEPLASDTIVVYGEQRREEVARSVWTADELRLVPGSFGDPIRALQSLPGVARPSSIEGAIVVRGAEGINTGTYVDEIPVPYLFHFFIGRSLVNPSLLHDVEFYPGGMPSRFGDTTQAIVNARTLEHEVKRGLHGRVSADLLDFSASLEANPRGGPWSFQGGYRASWIPQVASAGVRVYAALKGLGGDRPGYPVLEYNDWLVRAAYAHGPDRVTLTALGATDTFRVVLPRSDTDGDGRPDDLVDLDLGLPYDPQKLMDTWFYRLQARWDRTGAHEQTTWVAAGPDRQSSLLEGIGQLADGVEFGELSGWYVVARRRDKVDVGPTTVKWGEDLWLNPVTVEDWSELDDLGSPKRTKELRTSVGAWAEVQHTFGETFVAPGLRIAGQGFQGRTRPQLEPRLTVRTPVADHWTFAGFVGRFSQIPPADRYADGIGNPDLDLITAWQASASLQGRWPAGIEVDATLYGSRSDGLVVEDTRVEIEGTAGSLDPSGLPTEAESKIVPYYHAVTGYAFGVEGLVRVRPSDAPYFGWLAVTVGRALRVDDGTGEVTPGDYDLPVSVSLVAAYEAPKKWRFSGRIRATSGYPYTPVTGVSVPQWNGWAGLTGDNNGARFPWFRQIDVRVDKTWVQPRARWTLYLDTFNTLNTRNWFLATYTPNYSQLQKIVWIPVIPTLGLEVKY